MLPPMIHFSIKLALAKPLVHRRDNAAVCETHHPVICQWSVRSSWQQTSCHNYT